MDVELVRLVDQLLANAPSVTKVLLRQEVSWSARDGILRQETGLTPAGAELLELLRIKLALERIEEAGARYTIHNSACGWSPLTIWFADGYSKFFGNTCSALTAEDAEAGASYAEAQAAPKVCKHCGKRCE